VITGQHFTFDSIMAQIEGLLWDQRPNGGEKVTFHQMQPV
jgi:hypothetical protein